MVIGGTAKIGKRVRLYQGVGLVARSLAKHVERDEQGQALGGKRHPTVGDDVTIYANATIVGGDTIIGDRSIIGGNVWLTRSIPPDSGSAFRGPAGQHSSTPAHGRRLGHLIRRSKVMQRFYLDDNATTNLDPRVHAVMEPLLPDTWAILPAFTLRDDVHEGRSMWRGIRLPHG